MLPDTLGYTTRLQRTALLVGNSDGIGLATTKRLLVSGWEIIGISRSDSPIVNASYRHIVRDVTDPDYPAIVESLVRDEVPDLCIYFVGIGEFLDPLNMSCEPRVIDVNLTGMVKTAAAVLPGMIQSSRGHFIGISSFADELTSPEAPSYFASKAGFSSYLRSLAAAVRTKGVFVTNIRFGFVDTKMAKGAFRPMMMSVEKAADHVEHCIRRKPVTHSAPRIAIPFLKALKWMMRLRM